MLRGVRPQRRLFRSCGRGVPAAAPQRPPHRLAAADRRIADPLTIRGENPHLLSGDRKHSSARIDLVTEKRQSAALQNKLLGTGAMAIGEFGGAAAGRGGRPVRGPMYAAPAYWLYEMGQASLNPARAFADAGKLFFKNPANPWSHTELGKTVAAALRIVRALDPPLRQAGMEHQFDAGRRRARAGAHLVGLGAAVLPAPAFRARVRASAAAAAAASCSSSRRCRATTRRCCAARSKASCPITTSTSPNGSTRAWCRCRRAVRSRRLHRLPDLDAAFPRRRRATSSRCASRRCRCWPRSRAWKPTAIRTCRIRWC